jgi:lipopolysaccharide transport protein LptA
LKSGQNTIRGDSISVDEAAGGRRKLVASGHVVCRLYSRNGTGESARRHVPIDVTSEEMTYDEASRNIVYRTNVRIRRGDIETSSPTATVVLGGDGDSLESLVAGEPVEVSQGTRKAQGRQASYTPADETMVIVGEKVLLTEPSRTVQGRRVVFVVGRDQVRVEGLDETRTETVIRNSKGKTAP